LYICAFDFIDLLSLLKELERRHRRYSTFLRDIFCFVHIALCEDYRGGGCVGLCELVEDGGDDFAGPAPSRVEIDDEEGVGFELVELR